MRATISKQFDFDAAHWLPHVPAGHKCGNVHGHTYRVELICEGEVDPKKGWLCDYADLAFAWTAVDARVDHRLLNDVKGLENPTTEVLAGWILEHVRPRLAFLSAVRVYESATTWCEVRP